MSSSSINTRLASLTNTIVTRRPTAGFSNLSRNVTSITATSGPKDENLNNNAQAKSYKSIPGLGGIYNVPYLGLALIMKPFGKYTPETFPLLLNSLVDQYGPIFRIRTTHPSVVITDPEDIATLTRNEGKYPFRPPLDILEMYSKRTGQPSSMGDLQGKDWWKLRVPMQKAMLKPSVMPCYLPEMNQVADELVNMLANGYLTNHDAEKTFMAYAAESVGAICFNKRLGFMDQNQTQQLKNVQEAIINVFEIFNKSISGFSSYKLYRSKEYTKFESSLALLYETVEAFLKDAMNELRTKQNIDKGKFLNSILKVSTEEETRRIIEAAFLGGIDSSASAIQVVLHTLAIHQDKQQKLREELKDVLGNATDENKPVTDENLRNMPYLKACIKEVYRLYPLSPTGIMRILTEDIVFSGYKVPAGVQVIVHPMRSCQNPAIFQDPTKFEPERWLREDTTKKVGDMSATAATKWAVMPFGVGARSCPGRRIFEQELYLIVSKLIHGLKVGVRPESEDVEFTHRIFWKPVKPIQFTFTPA